jgi:hypothetical protein
MLRVEIHLYSVHIRLHQAQGERRRMRVLEERIRYTKRGKERKGTSSIMRERDVKYDGSPDDVAVTDAAVAFIFWRPNI